MKLLPAYRKEGLVFVGETIVPDCPVFGEGGSSTGVLVISEDQFIYFPQRSQDLVMTLTYISKALSTIASGVLKANLGGDITTPTFATDLAEIKTKVDDLRKILK